jgi:hypothetical protein
MPRLLSWPCWRVRLMTYFPGMDALPDIQLQ